MRNLRNEVRRVVREELSHSRVLNEEYGMEFDTYSVLYGTRQSSLRTFGKENMPWNMALAHAKKLTNDVYQKGLIDMDVNYIGVESVHGVHGSDVKFAIFYVNDYYLNKLSRYGNLVHKKNYDIFKTASIDFINKNLRAYDGRYKPVYGEYIAHTFL